ncbi:hypothetical protein MJO29_010187 [Puccinia striiformis f. sp. tritici]|nr:hypothetical protein MJO29_010187 [Puccinia striiformis f. sp. tritici]
MVCLSLPVSMRYNPKDIFLVGIAPGPKEPSLEQTNWILQPIIDQLAVLWKSGLCLLKTFQHPQGRVVSAALLTFFADLPALCRALGFAAPTATQMSELYRLDAEAKEAEKEAEKAQAEAEKNEAEAGRAKANTQPPPLVANKRQPATGKPPKNPQARLPRPPAPEEPETYFLEMLFGTSTDPSDTKFTPAAGTHEWGGEWVPPSDGKVIFDGPVLSHINSTLKRIHIPKWIKQAIPVLGKASFGRLKADEWRNLFTIQLPLILPAIWNNNYSASESLLHNFAHLVSLVNLALKRQMTLLSALPIAPNHHMAFHLAVSLKRFGPSRAWWSFSMEQLMGHVLKSTGNNGIGQLEVTYLTNFARIANLRAILGSNSFPPSFQPYVNHIRSLYHPITFASQTVSNHRQTSLEVSNFHQLIERLNQIAPLKGANWIASNEWATSLSNTNAPVTSRVQAYSNLKQGDVVYSNMKTNKSNCVVELKSNSPAKYGMIKMIFTHLRTPPGLHPVSSTWLAVHPLIPVPSNTNPFAQLKKYDSLGVALRRVEYSQEHIVLLDDVLAQCAWMTYKPEELGPGMAFETTAIVSLNPEHLTFKPAETGIVKPALPAGLYRLKTQSMSADLQLGMLLLPPTLNSGPPNHPGARDFSLRTRMIALQSEPGAKIVIHKAHNGPTDVQVKLVDLIEATLAGAGGLVVMSGYMHWTVFLRGCPGHDTIAVEGRRLTNDMICLACSAEQVRQEAALIRLEQQDRAILDRIPLGRNAPELAISSLTTNACRPDTLTTGFLNDHTLTRPPLSDYLQHVADQHLRTAFKNLHINHYTMFADPNIYGCLLQVSPPIPVGLLSILCSNLLSYTRLQPVDMFGCFLWA